MSSFVTSISNYVRTSRLTRSVPTYNHIPVADFKEKVSSAYPECTLVLECDVTSDTALDDIFEQAEKTFGQLDYVINSAGIMDPFDPAGDMKRATWDRVIAINLTAPAMITRRAVNMMMKKQIKGAIVNVASIAGFRGFTNGVSTSNCGV